MEVIKLSKLVNFTEKQKYAWECLKKYKYLLYGGAMGGGKSYFLRWALVLLLIKWFKEKKKRGIRVGLFCEDYPTLRDRHLSKIKYEFPDWLGVLKWGANEFHLSSDLGEGVICFRNLDDPSKYRSAEFAAIAIDELTQNKEEVFTFLRTRLRWPGIKDTKFLAGTNPGGVGHNWVKKIWFDKQFEPGEKEADKFFFVPATAYDNPYLDESYYAALEGLPPKLRKAYLEGNWEIFAGQYFSEWNPQKHICEPFPIPISWPRFRSYDHGRENPACCLWFALDYEGRVWCYRELYVRGWNADQIAREINKLSEGENYVYSVADPSIFAKMGHGETIAEVFARNGIVFIPASNKRIDGWNAVHQYLYWDEKTLPKIMFFKTCLNTIRTLPTLVHDEKKPEDLDTRGEDHAADALRYFLQTLRERKGPKPLTEVEKKLLKLKQESSFLKNLDKFYGGEFYHPQEDIF